MVLRPRLSVNPGSFVLLLTVAVVGSSILYLIRNQNDVTDVRRNLFVQHSGTYNVSDPLKIAWLLSFPNSGTTFTHGLVMHSSRRNVANNYGTVVELPSGKMVRNFYPSMPVYEERTNGPYLSSNLELPKKYILTKTHCGGYCTNCGPATYFVKRYNFLFQCLTGFKYTPPKITEAGCCGEHGMVRYDGNLVKKVVHLVRHPIDNIAARFHHEYKLSKKHNKEFIKQHGYNDGGVLRWCQETNDRYLHQELEWFPMMAQFTDVPCRSEFFKYIQWHNLAIFTTSQLKLDAMVLHYEDFHHDYDKTVNSLISFLELKIENSPPSFHFHSYPDVFTPRQIDRIWAFMMAIAEEHTKDMLKRYQPNSKAA